MEHDKLAEEITSQPVSDQLQGKRVHEVSTSSQGPEEKRMRPSEFAEYDGLLSELAEELRLARHPDSLVLLRATRLLIDNHCLSSAASSTRGPLRIDEPHSKTMGRGGSGRIQQLESANDGGGGGAGRHGDAEPGEIRIQGAKFTLADVVLPKALLEAAENNLAKRDGGQAAPAPADSADVAARADCVSHETRSGAAATAAAAATSMTTATKDELVGAFERASKALKLLYLDDQRQLQNQVNELISAIQAITANPKTDPRLLATGR